MRVVRSSIAIFSTQILILKVIEMPAWALALTFVFFNILTCCIRHYINDLYIHMFMLLWDNYRYIKGLHDVTKNHIYILSLRSWNSVFDIILWIIIIQIITILKHKKINILNIFPYNQYNRFADPQDIIIKQIVNILIDLGINVGCTS